MGRSMSGWEVCGKTPLWSTPWVSFEIWKVRHRTDHPGTVRDYAMVLAHDYVGVIGRTEAGQAILNIEDHVADGLDLQVVYGTIGKGEAPEEAALREFSEESPWHARQVIPLGTHIPHNDRIVSATEGNDGAKTCYMFLALGLTASQQHLEVSEKIHSILVPWDVAVHAAWTGEVIESAGPALTDTGSRLILLLADRYLREHHAGL